MNTEVPFFKRDIFSVFSFINDTKLPKHPRCSYVDSTYLSFGEQK